MRKNKIRILHVAQAAGGVDRYIRMLLKYLDKDKFENILVCSQDFHKEDYNDLVDYFEQIEMTRAIGGSDLLTHNFGRNIISTKCLLGQIGRVHHSGINMKSSLREKMWRLFIYRIRMVFPAHY